MATSTKVFVEPSSGWLNVNGMSLGTEPVEPYQSASQIYDDRMKHLQSPVPSFTPPLASAPKSIPYHITIIDGPFQFAKRQQQKLEAIEISKKLFADRPMKKSKSLPGLIKASMSSRQTPLHSVSLLIPRAPASSVNHSHDDLVLSMHNETPNDCVLVPAENIDSSQDIRRPKVYFADFNNIQFIEDKKELQQQKLAAVTASYRRAKTRPLKKSYSINQQVSPPSIQQPQTLEHFSRSGSRQQGSAAARPQPLHITHLPDILNVSLPNEHHVDPRPVVHRERPPLRTRKTLGESPANLNTEISRDAIRTSRIQSSSTRDSHLHPTHVSMASDLEQGLPMGRRTSLVSSSSNARQRSSHRTVSLRQHFISPFRMDSNQPSQQSHYGNSLTSGVRRSASYRHPTVHFQNEDVLSDHRSVARSESAKQIKRSHVIQLNSKHSSTRNSTTDLSESHRPSIKANQQKNSKERFQNLLTIVRVPYANGTTTANHTVTDALVAPVHPTPTGTRRSSLRRASAQGPLEFHIASNTIVV